MYPINEEVFSSRISLSEETPSCLQEFQKFQYELFSKAKSDELFVISSIYFS